MSSDLRNVFARKKGQTSLADDRVNRFERHLQVVAARRRDTSLHDNRVQRREDDRAAWTKQTAPPTASGGTRLTSDLVGLKAASDASRTAAKQPSIVINPQVLKAVVMLWRSESPDGVTFFRFYEESAFNKESFNNAVQHLIARGAPIDPELPQAAYESCVSGNHLEPKKRRDRDGNVVTLRSEAGRPTPALFPRVIWPDEAAAEDQARHELAVEAASAEVQRALSLPFAELQKHVRVEFKSPKPGEPNLDRS
jgi:hypothetical protein